MHQRRARVEENQDRLAGSELLDVSGLADPLALGTLSCLCQCPAPWVWSSWNERDPGWGPKIPGCPQRDIALVIGPSWAAGRVQSRARPQGAARRTLDGSRPAAYFRLRGRWPVSRRLLARAPGKLAGRLISQRTMRPLRVVVLAPSRDLALGVRQVREPMRVQTFLAEPSVETFDESILHGFAGLDEVLPHLRFQRPRLHGPRLKLRSVGARGRPPGRKLPTLPLFCGEPRSEPEIERADSQQQYAGNGRCAPVAGPGPRQEQRNTDHGAERRHRKG